MDRLIKYFGISTLTIGQCIAVAIALLLFCSLQSQESKSLTINKVEQYSDSSAQVLKLLYAASLKNKDTLEAVLSLQKLASIYSHKGKHKESYENLWEALLLSDASKMDTIKILIYRDIGRHYSYYKRKEKSLEFLNLSLNLRKRLISEDKIKPETLSNSYLAFVATYREFNDFKSAKIYLDSSNVYLKNSTIERDKAFSNFENGAILNNQGNYNKALEHFNKCKNWFSKKLPAFLVLINTYEGDSYKSLKKYRVSKSYYLNALELSKTNDVHKDFTPLIHERLSDLYLIIGDKDNAFSSLKTAKELDALYFDSRSTTNRALLEIQDEFLEEKKRQAIHLKEQRLEQLEHEEKVTFLERILLFGFIVFLILFGILYFSYVKSKHKAEKRIIKKKQELEEKKNKEIIELKNKELATSVIKLIEKEAFIDKLKVKLSNGVGDINRSEAKQIINSISINNSENWSEFETRFVSINNKFYKKLTKRYPNLTQNDQRLCALVKLNFSSKEIAKLLNMSNESVHTTRSRLRKKLKLSREVNLKQFIASL